MAVDKKKLKADTMNAKFVRGTFEGSYYCTIKMKI